MYSKESRQLCWAARCSPRGTYFFSPCIARAHPPYAVPQVLEGLEQNSDGLYKTEEVLERFDEAIAEYDRMLEKYGVKDNSAVTVPEEPAVTEEEALDEAA